LFTLIGDGLVVPYRYVAPKVFPKCGYPNSEIG